MAYYYYKWNGSRGNGILSKNNLQHRLEIDVKNDSTQKIKEEIEIHPRRVSHLSITN